MSSSDDTENDLVDNNNNIITTLQSHENAIQRNEETMKQMKKHILELETHLSIERKTMDTYLSFTATKKYTDRPPLNIFKVFKMGCMNSLRINYLQKWHL